MTNDVSAQLILAFINDAWMAAPDAANTFREQLVKDQVDALRLIKQGSIASVGKNSASQAYKNYGAGVLTHTQIVETYVSILALYDQIKSDLTCQFVASADFDYVVPAGFDFDAPIYDALTKVFNAQSSGTAQMLPDISRLRIPPNTVLNPAGVTW